MGRYFEKISFEQFSEDVKNDLSLYENYLLPKRSSKYSAGYDFFAIDDVVIPKGERLKIPTGIKMNIGNDEVLLIVVRSSMGFKYNIRMCNQVGVIDSDYYNNPDNEGHIWIKLQNEGDSDFVIKKNNAICQGIITKYLTVDNEENICETRKGGIGSTDRGDNNG